MSKRKQKRNPLVWGIPIVVVLLLAVWLPSVVNRGELPKLGEPIKDFVATDVNGERFQLSEAYSQGEVILVFYRGYG